VLWKHGRKGQPHRRLIRVTHDGFVHSCKVDDGMDSKQALNLRRVTSVTRGKGKGGPFARTAKKGVLDECCFSIISPERELHLECASEADCTIWYEGILWKLKMMKNLSELMQSSMCVMTSRPNGPVVTVEMHVDVTEGPEQSLSLSEDSKDLGPGSRESRGDANSRVFKLSVPDSNSEPEGNGTPSGAQQEELSQTPPTLTIAPSPKLEGSHPPVVQTGESPSPSSSEIEKIEELPSPQPKVSNAETPSNANFVSPASPRKPFPRPPTGPPPRVTTLTEQSRPRPSDNGIFQSLFKSPKK